MKYFLLLGGFLGFVLVLASGVYAGKNSVDILWDACFASLVGGLLFRILHAAFVSGIRARLMERSQVRAEPDADSLEAEPRPRSRRRRP
jgi:hypothetical protein